MGAPEHIHTRSPRRTTTPTNASTKEYIVDDASLIDGWFDEVLSLPHLRWSYQDGYQLVALPSDDFILLLHWEIRQLAP